MAFSFPLNPVSLQLTVRARSSARTSQCIPTLVANIGNNFILPCSGEGGKHVQTLPVTRKSRFNSRGTSLSAEAQLPGAAGMLYPLQFLLSMEKVCDKL